ncbi:MAG: hypothetical protein ACI8RZ_002402 [Myxococcota bacterium]|jgi:hypothetical protein
MAGIRRHPHSPPRHLVQDTLIGRSPDALIHLSTPHASSNHAALHWTGRGWVVRDLGSSNGTTVNGQPLAPGVSMPLQTGAVLTFGSAEERWVIEDATPPLPAARNLSSAALVFLQDGYITLPNPEDPAVVVFEHPSLGWLVEQDEDINPATHGQVIMAGGTAWRLHLADAAGTISLQRTPRTLAEGTLRFFVSTTEENVDVEVQWSDEVRKLPPSVHWYIALLLARARQVDEAEGTLPPRERGWLYREELCHQLRTAARKLNVDIHRLRVMLAGAGIIDGASLFERRSSTAQIRLGIADLEIG